MPQCFYIYLLIILLSIVYLNVVCFRIFVCGKGIEKITLNFILYIYYYWKKHHYSQCSWSPLLSSQLVLSSHLKINKNNNFLFIWLVLSSTLCSATTVWLSPGWLLNPFPHIDAFWRLCSRQLFEYIVTKEEIAFATMFSTFCNSLGYPFNYGDFLCFYKIHSKSSAAELSYEGKG